MSSICTSNLTSGFIDLATYDEQERYLYGSDSCSFTYFVREHHKATWFTQVPVVLSKATGGNVEAFNRSNDWSVSISRAGDYLLQTWLRFTLPQVCPVTAPIGQTQNTYLIRWTNNIGHNIIRECCITFNDLSAARFDNYFLDFWAAFTVPESKLVGYNAMIGNVDALIQCAGAAASGKVCLPQYTCNVPLPFWYARDSGVALPTAALPYNDMRINFSFRGWEELLNVYTTAAAPNNAPNNAVPVGASQLQTGAPTLSNVMVWANYAIVANDERKKMACAARDILIEQVQTAPVSTFQPAQNRNPVYDIRFSHAVKSLYFAVRNTSLPNEWSNYTTRNKNVSVTGVVTIPDTAVDPIEHTSIIYENTQRLYQMGSDYYSLVQPWYTAPRIPEETGYHLYSYSLDLYSLDPMGSTNYGKLTNVSILPYASADAQTQAQAGSTFNFVCVAVNNNIVRIAGGTLGFPVL